MTERVLEDEQSNYEIFRECLSVPILKALAVPEEKPKGKKKKDKKLGKKNPGVGGDASEPVAAGFGGKQEEEVIVVKESEGEEKKKKKENFGEGNDAEDLGDFIDYLSTLLFTSLPPHVRGMTPSTYQSMSSLQANYALPLSTPTTNTLLSTLSPTALSTLESYLLLPSPPTTSVDLTSFFVPIFTSYLAAVTVAPPVPIWSSTRTSACELCHREWIPLTYHHLIPRSTHAKVVKRGWHKEDMLGSVAWLCRACHSFVHRVETNEGLARWWYSVELLEKREDVRKWVAWVGRVRWKAR